MTLHLASIAATAGRDKLTDREQQCLFPAALPFGHSLHSTQLPLGKLNPMGLVCRITRL